MKRPALPFRIAAIASSLLLLTLFVYDQAGGKVFQKLGLSRSSPPEEPLLPGPKSKAIPVIETDSAEMLPGSKSAMVFEGELLPATSTKLLPGSKSIVVEPATPTLPTAGNVPNPFPANQRAENVAPATSPPTLLPGSKAPGSLFNLPRSEGPPATPQPAQQQSLQQQPAQQSSNNRGR